MQAKRLLFLPALLAFVALPMVASPASALTTLEGFEAYAELDTPGTFVAGYNPPYSAYNSGGGTGVVQSGTVFAGTKALKATGSATHTFQLATDQCGIDFYVRITALPGSGTLTIAGGSAFTSNPFATSSTGNEWFALGVTSAGAMQLRTHSFTSTSPPVDTGVGSTMAINTWYHVALVCSASGITLKDFTNGATVTASFAHVATQSVFAISTTSLGNVFLDNIGFQTASTFSPANTATVTGLVAFDVDDTGTTAIARTDSGDFIRTYSGQSLGTEFASFDTNCAGFGRVIAEGENVAYIDCNGAEDSLEVRSYALATPEAPAICDASDVDEFNNFGADPDDIFTISDFGALTIDYEFSDDDCSGFAAVIATTFDGRIGVITKAMVGGLVQDSSKFVAYGPSSLAVNQICGSVMLIPGDSDPTVRDMVIYAADSTLNTRAWQWDQNTFNPALSNYKTFSGQFGQASSLACSSNNATVAKFIVGTGAGVRAINPATESQLWQRTDLLPSSNGIALSRDGAFAAVTAGSTTYLLNATTGQTVASITNPSGSFRDVEIDSRAQSVWIATSTTIARYDVYSVTTINPVGTGFGQDPCFGITGCDEDAGTDTDTDGNFLVPSPDNVPAGFTQSSFSFLLGVLFLFAVAGGAYFALGKSPIAAGIGGVGGFLGGFAFGLFPLWAVLLVALIAAAVVVLKFRGAGA